MKKTRVQNGHKTKTVFMVLFILLSGFTAWHYTTKTMAEEMVPEVTNVIVDTRNVKEWVFDRWQEEYGTEVALDVARLIQCESQWRPEIVIIEPNDTISLGLYQINTVHKDISNPDKLDYKKATEWTIAKYQALGNSFKIWSCAKKLGIK